MAKPKTAQAPYCIIWHRLLKRGFALDRQYRLLKEPVDLSKVKAASIFQEAHAGSWMPFTADQVPQWAMDKGLFHRNVATGKVEPVTYEDWVTYWSKPKPV